MDERLISHDDDIITFNNELLFNPYNSLNKEISLKDLQTILTTYGIPGKINNFEFIYKALAIPIFCLWPPERLFPSSPVLEFILFGNLFKGIYSI